MNRRELLTFPPIAAVLSPRIRAQGGAPSPVKLQIDIYSRRVLRLRNAAEVAAAAHEPGYDGIDLTIRPGARGHVDPDRVATDLPPFVAAIRQAGLQIHSITALIVDAQSHTLKTFCGQPPKRASLIIGGERCGTKAASP